MTSSPTNTSARGFKGIFCTFAISTKISDAGTYFLFVLCLLFTSISLFGLYFIVFYCVCVNEKSKLIFIKQGLIDGNTRIMICSSGL